MKVGNVTCVIGQNLRLVKLRKKRLLGEMGYGPSYFGAFTSARYQWSALRKLLEMRDKCDVDFARAPDSTRHRVSKYHGLTSCFGALKLESLLKYCAVDTLDLTYYSGIREWPPTGDMIHLHFSG